MLNSSTCKIEMKQSFLEHKHLDGTNKSCGSLDNSEFRNVLAIDIKVEVFLKGKKLQKSEHVKE